MITHDKKHKVVVIGDVVLNYKKVRAIQKIKLPECEEYFFDIGLSYKDIKLEDLNDLRDMLAEVAGVLPIKKNDKKFGDGLEHAQLNGVFEPVITFYPLGEIKVHREELMDTFIKWCDKLKHENRHQ